MTTVTCEVESSYAAVAATGVQVAKLYGKAVHEQSRLLFAGNRTGRRLGDGTTIPAWYKYLPLRHRRGRCGMQVFVRTPAGKSLALVVDPSDTVDEVKARIQARERVAAAQQRLVFAGKHLDDGRRSLADYGVGKEANLHLLLRLRGGAAGGDSDTSTGGTHCWAWATTAGLLAIVLSVGTAVGCFPEAAAAASGSHGAALFLFLLAIAVAGVNLITAGVCLSGTAAADARLAAAQRASTRVLAAFARRNLGVLAVSGASLAVTGVVDSAARPVLCFGFFALFLVAMSLTMACCSA